MQLLIYVCISETVYITATKWLLIYKMFIFLNVHPTCMDASMTYISGYIHFQYSTGEIMDIQVTHSWLEAKFLSSLYALGMYERQIS